MPEEKPLTVDLIKEDPTALVIPRSPMLSSYKAGWSGIHLEHHRRRKGELVEHCAPQHRISIHLNTPVKEERVLKGHTESKYFVSGDVCIAPANLKPSMRWHSEGKQLLLYLEPGFAAGAASDLVELDRIEIISHFGKPDPLIYQIGLALKAELETDGLSSLLYVESLSTAISAHLMRHYSASKPEIPQYSDGLTQQQLRCVIEYINENLARDLTLTELATIVQMSPYHFARKFKQSTRLPPHRYLVQRRLEKAKKLLAITDLGITEIAYRVGFASSSRFCTAFRQYTAMSPKAYRKAL